MEENNKEGKMTAYIFFFYTILALAMATFMILNKKELFQNDMIALIFVGFAGLMAFLNFLLLCLLYCKWNFCWRSLLCEK